MKDWNGYHTDNVFHRTEFRSQRLTYACAYAFYIMHNINITYMIPNIYDIQISPHTIN